MEIAPMPPGNSEKKERHGLPDFPLDCALEGKSADPIAAHNETKRENQ